MPTRHDASLKHSQYYAEIILHADRLYEQGGDGLVDGLRLFDDNWRNIEIGQKWATLEAATDETAASLVSEYPERGPHCLYQRQKPGDRIKWFESALQVAHTRGFELLEASLHAKIGLAFTEMGEYQKAIEHYSIQLKFAEKFQDSESLGEGACNLGILYDNLDMLEPAQECYQYALDLADKIKHPKITEVAVGNLGLVYLKQGKFSDALHCFERHLQLARQNGDQWSEGNALTNKGIACLKLQDYGQAATCFCASIAINKKLDDLAGEAKNFSYLGVVLDAFEDLDGAAVAHQTRIALAQKLGDLRGEATGYWNLGKILIKQKKYERGLEFMYKCVDFEKNIGDPAWEDDLRTIKAIEKSRRNKER